MLVGEVPDAIETPHPRHLKDRWPERLAGRAVQRVDTHGKNLFVVFEGGLVLHSHLRMTGAWDVRPVGGRWIRSPRRAWLMLRRGDSEVVQFDGPVLELMTGGRRRFDQRLAGLGPDVLAPSFDERLFLARLRADDADTGDRRRADRPTERRRNRKHLEVRGLLGSRDRSVATGARPQRRRSPGGDRRGQAADARVGPAWSEVDARRACTGERGMPCPRCGAAVRSAGQGMRTG